MRVYHWWRDGGFRLLLGYRRYTALARVLSVITYRNVRTVEAESGPDFESGSSPLRAPANS